MIIQSSKFISFFVVFHARLNVILGIAYCLKCWNALSLILCCWNFSTLFQITHQEKEEEKHNTTVYRMQTHTCAHALLRWMFAYDYEYDSQTPSALDQANDVSLHAVVSVCGFVHVTRPLVLVSLKWKLTSTTLWLRLLLIVVVCALCTLRSRQYVVLKFIYIVKMWSHTAHIAKMVSLSLSLSERTTNFYYLFFFCIFLCRICCFALFFRWLPIHSRIIWMFEHNQGHCISAHCTVIRTERFVPYAVAAAAAGGAGARLLLFLLLPSQRWLRMTACVLCT